jgi:hypothetical protein
MSSDVGPDAEFRAATRTRLVAMAAVRTPATAPSARRPPVRAGRLHRLLVGHRDAPASRWQTRLTAGLAGAALTVTALGGLLGASQGARPGDLLYDLKRGGEQTQLALASDAERGRTLLDFARNRLDEVSELVGVQPRADAVVGSSPSGGETALAAGPEVDLVLDTLQTMDRQTTEGTAELTTRAVEEADGEALALLSGWTADQQSGLGALTAAMPAGAQGALAAAQDLVGQVAARSTALRDALECPTGPATGGADELGPLPTDCPSPPPASTGTPSPSAPSGTGATPSASPGGITPGTGPTAPPTSGAPAATTAGPAGGGGAGGSAGSGGGAGAGGGGGGGAAQPTTAAPGTTPRPGLPLPTLPSAPAPSATSPAPTTSPGAIVSVPPLVPGVKVCLPPLITVGC